MVVSQMNNKRSRYSFFSESLYVCVLAAIIFDDVEIQTPAGASLVKHLSFKLEAGKNVLITGPNGSGT